MSGREKIEADDNRQSFWQAVFSQSRVNDAPYFGELLPRWQRTWPQDTWLQRKLRERDSRRCSTE